ncbi:MAG TPA: MerR family transcriptional regulator [Streptosporangiaceae bacterium]|jgi:DNA-binding transcriptional MerR regulator|nr:MerR family transcriptional regulator [Streptosporangiaceae bacterium]
MFSIGEFARHGRVSVRMLRHYDAIGLLRPACVDPASGYRFYQARQLSELNRVIALKELGFTLQQVQAILEEQVSAAELRGMLKLRRAEIHAQIEAETTRLARVEARLLTIEDEARVPTDGVVIKHLAPVRVAELTGTATGYEPECITPVIQPLYCDLWQRMASAGVTASGPAIAYYEDTPTGHGSIVVHAAVPVVTEAVAGHDLNVTDLPEVQTAAAIIHHGSMNDVIATGQALAWWIDANGYRSAGYAREVTLEWSADTDQWVTELQQPIYTTGG